MQEAEQRERAHKFLDSLFGERAKWQAARVNEKQIATRLADIHREGFVAGMGVGAMLATGALMILQALMHG